MSDFQTNHCTETTLLKVINDVFIPKTSETISTLILCDL